MKSPRKVTRIKLEDSDGEKFIVLGVVSAEPDYKLSLLINKKMGFSLKSSAPVSVLADGKDTHFSRFSFTDESSGINYSLIVNRSEAGLLIKQLRNIDFIFFVSDPEARTDQESIVSQLRGTESVTGVFIISADIAKDRAFQSFIG